MFYLPMAIQLKALHKNKLFALAMFFFSNTQMVPMINMVQIPVKAVIAFKYDIGLQQTSVFPGTDSGAGPFFVQSAGATHFSPSPSHPL